MRPRKPKTTVKGDLFRAALEQLINMKHELVQLAADIIVDQVFDRLLRKLGSFRISKSARLDPEQHLEAMSGCRRHLFHVGEAKLARCLHKPAGYVGRGFSATNLHPFRLIRQAVVG